MKLIPPTKPELTRRQEALFASLPLGSALLVFAAEEKRRNADVSFPFRQNSDFWYLTGFNEPDSALLMLKTPSGEPKSIVFARTKDPEKEAWDGSIVGFEAARELLGVMEARAWVSLEASLAELCRGGFRRFYCDLAQGDHLLRKMGLLALLPSLRIPELMSVSSILGPLRLIKSPEERALMHQSAQINIAAHQLLAQSVQAGVSEYKLQGIIEGFYLEQGADWAYPSIVASGQNATTLHYRANNSTLQEGDLLLVDAGCEWSYYASDITRCWPVGSGLSGAKRDVYQIVLAAQEKALMACELPDASLQRLQELVVEVFAFGLKDLGGFPAESVEEIIQKKLYQKYYRHKVGHWLGLDVHDAGPYLDDQGKALSFQTGMCFTVEPGLYFPANDETLPSPLRGIGVRIEDNVLMEEAGPVLLTQGLQK